VDLQIGSVLPNYHFLFVTGVG